MNAGVNEQTLALDELFASEFPIEEKAVTLLSGQNVVRGEVLGLVQIGTIGTPSSVTGTGNGTCAGTIVAGKHVKAGTYTVRCIGAVTNLGDFVLIDPDGIVVGTLKVGTASTLSTHLNGILVSDGATDFVVGDYFTIAVAVGSLKAKAYDKDNVDGSAHAVGIAVEDCDASAADVVTSMYVAGCFKYSQLTYPTSDTGFLADFLKTPVIIKENL